MWDGWKGTWDEGRYEGVEGSEECVGWREEYVNRWREKCGVEGGGERGAWGGWRSAWDGGRSALDGGRSV